MSLPSLNALRAFEASARHGSFVAAADELSVSPAAIGQLVRKLEEQIDRQLFHRQGKRLQLTEAGLSAAPKIATAFRDLEAAVVELRGQTVSAHLTISVPPSFATGWLSSRISGFIEASGDIEVSIRAEDDPIRFEQDAIDVRLTYGDWHYPELLVEKVLDDIAMPVCAPSLLRSEEGMTAPEELLQLPLIHTLWPSPQASYPSWQAWIKQHCPTSALPAPTRGHAANTSKLAIDLAQAGLGVALAQRVYVADLLRDGALVCPITCYLPFEAPYVLNLPSRRAERPYVRAFCAWLTAEMRALETPVVLK